MLQGTRLRYEDQSLRALLCLLSSNHLSGGFLCALGKGLCQMPCANPNWRYRINCWIFPWLPVNYLERKTCVLETLCNVAMLEELSNICLA